MTGGLATRSGHAVSRSLHDSFQGCKVYGKRITAVFYVYDVQSKESPSGHYSSMRAPKNTPATAPRAGASIGLSWNDARALWEIYKPSRARTRGK